MRWSGSGIIFSWRVLNIWIRFPPGRSVLPQSPINKASPVINASLSTTIQMPPGVCPGVKIKLRDASPTFSWSLSETVTSTFTLNFS